MRTVVGLGSHANAVTQLDACTVTKRAVAGREQLDHVVGTHWLGGAMRDAVGAVAHAVAPELQSGGLRRTCLAAADEGARMAWRLRALGGEDRGAPA